jgi:hypothetical protein
MVDEEVENTLREIRDRVRSRPAPESIIERATKVNGDGFENSTGDYLVRSHEENETTVVEALALLNSYLTTTARAWDRLPPLVSNRSGAMARLELWLKRHLKRATRWYSWEQINFNAAVHHALRDIVQLLSAQERTIENLREQLRAETEARQKELEQHEAQTQMLRSELDAQAVQVDVRLAEIVSELRDRTSRLQEEQRVSYKQLALETSEAAVLEDRARRKTEALVEELTRRVEQLKKK